MRARPWATLGQGRAEALLLPPEVRSVHPGEGQQPRPGAALLKKRDGRSRGSGSRCLRVGEGARGQQRGKRTLGPVFPALT